MGLFRLDSSKFRQHFRCTCHKSKKISKHILLKDGRKDNAKIKKFGKNLLRKILEFYIQRTNFSLDLMNDTRSNKALKDRSEYAY